MQQPALDALLTRIRIRTDTAAPRPTTAFTDAVVLVDGRSGSGKTDLATELAAAWPAPVTLVHLDDIYPGWQGLDAASRHIHDELLASDQPRWQRHDWVAGRAAEWASVDPNRALIIEGMGSLSRQNAALATFTIWVELDDSERKRRALARDGSAYEPYWDEWAAHELAFIAREQPARLADLVLER
ncbi:ATP-binding protein [Subtercola sp. RTI3]|uniref:ATP-binding protein n=1 Tax=Subtercola sp. RTI3 TaxID=3048639 RepID=UPI002B22DB45|nr:ATP-binding protein [Subtercola sp. RTI3]MEA9986371.1 ATP-binding protein [Subtercola sp. RTI3]